MSANRTRQELAWHDARRPRAHGKTPPLLPTLLGVYAVVAVLSAAVAVLLDRDPLSTSSWIGLDGGEGAAWSVAIGAFLAAFTIASTRWIVRRAAWARALHVELRPAVHDVGGVPLALMALASGVAEELFFRGLLTPLVGVLVSSIAFGLLHQVRGRARWVWMAWATAMGLLFALLFELTGSLAGPIVAHVLINGANLRFLRDTDVSFEPEPRHAKRRPSDARAMGGLFRRAQESSPGTSAHEMP